MSHFVYILQCVDGSLYVGATNNLEKRLHEHNHAKRGAHYTKIRRPVVLKYSQMLPSLAAARAREAALKRLSRAQKLALIAQLVIVPGHMSTILPSIRALNALLAREKPLNVCIVTSKSLARRLAWAIQEMKVPVKDIILVPDGEAAKRWSEAEKLLKKFVQLGLDRQSIVIALGGGTVGDAAGFAASVYLRGIRYAQVPTTLLAQVDSAHGGKTGIDFALFKNIVGTIAAPIAIIVDPRFLKSLSRGQTIDGLGEILKAGLIKDPSILALLAKEKVSTLTKSRNLSAIIAKSIAVKDFYTRADPRESGLRQMLNAGHTIAHALELKYKMSHGRAVIEGLRQELALGEKLGITEPKVRMRFEALLKHLGIPLDAKLKPDWQSILHDKKRTGNFLTLPLIISEGKPKLVRLPIEKLKPLLK